MAATMASDEEIKRALRARDKQRERNAKRRAVERARRHDEGLKVIHILVPVEARGRDLSAFKERVQTEARKKLRPHGRPEEGHVQARPDLKNGSGPSGAPALQPARSSPALIPSRPNIPAAQPLRVTGLKTEHE